MCRWYGLHVKSGHVGSLDTHTQRFVKQCDNRHNAHRAPQTDGLTDRGMGLLC